MNRNIRRRVLSAAVALAVCAILPAPFSLVQAQTPAKPKVALVMKSLANEFFLTMETGAKDYQKHNPGQFDLITNGIKDETDTATQIRIVEQMIVSKVDALVIAPADSKALVPVIKKAVDAGIIVVNIDNRLDPDVLKSKDLNVPFVGPDNAQGREDRSATISRSTCKSGDEVGIIEGVSTTTNAQQRTAGFKARHAGGRHEGRRAAIGRLGNRQGQRGGSADPERESECEGAPVRQRQHGDRRGLGVRAAGKAGKVQVVGYDNIDAIKPMLTDGRVLATADQYAAKQAVFGIDTALKAIAGA